MSGDNNTLNLRIGGKVIARKTLDENVNMPVSLFFAVMRQLVSTFAVVRDLVSTFAYLGFFLPILVSAAFMFGLCKRVEVTKRY